MFAHIEIKMWDFVEPYAVLCNTMVNYKCPPSWFGMYTQLWAKTLVTDLFTVLAVIFFKCLLRIGRYLIEDV